GRPDPLEEAGIAFTGTRERIRQIEATPLRKLRHPNRRKKPRDFLDRPRAAAQAARRAPMQTGVKRRVLPAKECNTQHAASGRLCRMRRAFAFLRSFAPLFQGTSGVIYCSDRMYTWQGFHASHSVGKTSSSLNPRLR